MDKQLSTKPAASVAVQTDNELNARGMMASLDDMARDPSVDIDKMERLAKMKIDLYDKARQEQFNKDFNDAVFAMPTIKKDGSIKDNSGKVRSRFSSFERLMSVVQPILRSHNLLVTFDVQTEGNLPKIGTITRHSNGIIQESGLMPVPISKPNNSVTMGQAAAMSVTLGKRHMLKATFGIVEEDDDGTGVMFRTIEHADWQEDLKTSARAQAVQGMAIYGAWYKAESAMHRGFLVDCGTHAECKAAAKLADDPSANHGDFPGDR